VAGSGHEATKPEPHPVASNCSQSPGQKFGATPIGGCCFSERAMIEAPILFVIVLLAIAAHAWRLSA
jgi:hypothetical protein